ncbi:thiol reductant ABC exporter subunit CydC [Paenibacillus sp. N1-5-1-14]|uniref:thiol reductant ABC exporter subunit CydC n=1 Tax=Paenibacillus radicibacter TaxID=2972488 RepID=UPI002159AB07|nr:thiol reductant ABC exporter subunit CydC [Paenibacillus radicibacter]MCR8642795.1 thiol reductant ABC exporter subunit CydC [Paenibacillus radicibacter]
MKQWIMPYVKTYYWRFVIIIAIGALTVMSASMLTFTSGYLISKSALRPENILMVYVPVVLVRTFGISRAVVHYIERLVGHDAVLRILSQMRVRLYRILEPQALFIRSRFRTGDILSVLADDIEHLQNVYIRTIFPAVVAALMYGVVVGVLGWWDLTFAIVMGLYLLVLVVVLPWVSLAVTIRKQQQMKAGRNRLYQKLTDAVLGISDWKISGRASQFLAMYEADEAEVTRVERSLSTWSRWRGMIAAAMVGFAVVIMIYWAGQQYADGKMMVTHIAAFVLVTLPIMDAFIPVSDAIEKIPSYKQSLSRLNAIGESDYEVEVHDALSIGQDSKSGVTDEAFRVVRQQAHISLQDVRYAYEGNVSTSDEAAQGTASVDTRQPIWSVDGVSLDIPQGKKVAIIGRSGAGKSTLLKLIQGAISPVSGEVRINNVPADAYGEHIPSVISVLNQSPHLFDTTLANNMRLGRRSASDEDIAEVAKLVRLDTLIESLPHGFDTPMHEAGKRFSGGERQRIALARVLLQETPVVILDEPTVGLDPRTERELLRTMFQTMEGKSLIWITHHLVGAEQMDEVIFMEDGKIEMRGTHAELMASYPRYRNLYHLDRPVGV